MSPMRSRFFAVLLAVSAVVAGYGFVSLASASHASGGSVPDAFIDGGRTGAMVYDGAYQGETNLVQQPATGLRYNTTYDVTFANLTAGNETTGLRLADNGGTPRPNGRDLTTDGAHVGKFNVTFPSFAFDQAGNWSLQTPSGAVLARIFVLPLDRLNVTTSPSTVQSGASVSFTITVAPLAAGQTATLSGSGLPQGTTVSGPSGQYVYFGPSPPVGTNTYRAAREVAGSTSVPEETGSGTLTVTAANSPLLVNVTPSTIGVGAWTNVAARVTDAYGNPVPDAQVRIARPDGSSASGDLDGGLSVNGTGTPGAGQNGGYAFFVRANVAGDFTVFATSGSSGGSAPLRSVLANAPLFRIGNVSGGLVPIRVPIELSSAVDLGSATVTLAVDTSVVQVDSVTNGTIPGATTTWSVNNSTGVLTVLVTTTARPGPSGDSVFAYVWLRNVGSPGASSPLDLTVVEAVHSDGSDAGAAAIDGSFRSGIVGDADGDGDIDAQDAAVIADAVVGHHPVIVTANADVTRDGRITGADAMFLRQYLAGTRSAL